ncbi:MAG: hypothetical protein JF612_07380 [Planctomycetia bacterium]|nr:hypothetical protein [Planctomycetia bacterium]
MKLLQSAPDAANLVAAAKEIDHYLVADPKSFGESRYDTVHVGFVLPLGVQYECLDDVRTVIVYDVWRVVRPT